MKAGRERLHAGRSIEGSDGVDPPGGGVMRLKWKILLGFLTLASMLFVAGVWSIHALGSIGTSVQQLLDDNYKSINAANRMQEALEREDSAVLLLLLGRREEGRSILDAGDRDFRDAFQAAEGNLTLTGEDRYMEQIWRAYEHYQRQWEAPIADTPREGSLVWYFTDVHSAFVQVKEKVAALKTVNEQSLYRTASDLKGRARRAVVPGTVATVAALVFSILFTYLVNQFMVGPIVRITRGIDAFVEKRRPFDVDVDTEDEIRDLALAVSKLCSASRSAAGEKVLTA